MLAGFAFGGFNAYGLGTVWFPSKVAMLWAAAGALLGLATGGIPSRVPGFGLWLVLTFWVVISALLAYAIPYPIDNVESSLLRTPQLRPLVQLVTYGTMLLLFPLGLAASARPGGRRRVLAAYAWLSLAAVVVAVWQLLSMRIGVPFMPILRMTGSSSASAAFSLGGGVVQRLYAFAGEPKALASFLVPMLFASLAVRLAGPARVEWWGHPAFAVALAAVILMTFSTAALLALGTGAVLLPFVVPGGHKHLRARLVARLVLVSIVLLLVLAAARWLGVISFDLLEAVRVRTTERLATSIDTRFELAALRYLMLEKPAFLFSGVGLGMFPYHIPGLLWGEGLDPIDSGWVSQLMDLGLVGVLLLILFVSTVWSSSWAGRGRVERPYLVASAAALLGAVLMNSGWGVFPYMMLFAGLGAAARVQRTAIPIRAGGAHMLRRKKTFYRGRPVGARFGVPGGRIPGVGR